jgi:hypothetical protein
VSTMATPVVMDDVDWSGQSAWPAFGAPSRLSPNATDSRCPAPSVAGSPAPDLEIPFAVVVNRRGGEATERRRVRSGRRYACVEATCICLRSIRVQSLAHPAAVAGVTSRLSSAPISPVHASAAAAPDAARDLVRAAVGHPGGLHGRHAAGRLAPLGLPLRGHLGLGWDDPLHFLRGTLWVAVRRRLAGIWRTADTAGRVSSGMLGRSLRGRR